MNKNGKNKRENFDEILTYRNVMIKWKSKNKTKGAHKRNERRNRWGCIHTHTIHSTKKNGNYLLDEREPQFSKINIEENRGKKASICDREKDRKQTDCIKQEDWKVFEVKAIVK